MKVRVGNRLLSIREERKMSQLEIAELLDLAPSTYARIERNESTVELEKLTTFAEKLNVPINELLPETLSIKNTSHNHGQGGGMVFGNQYFYLDSNESNKILVQENQKLSQENHQLKKDNQDFRSELDEIKKKLGI